MGVWTFVSVSVCIASLRVCLQACVKGDLYSMISNSFACIVCVSHHTHSPVALFHILCEQGSKVGGRMRGGRGRGGRQQYPPYGGGFPGGYGGGVPWRLQHAVFEHTYTNTHTQLWWYYYLSLPLSLFSLSPSLYLYAHAL